MTDDQPGVWDLTPLRNVLDQVYAPVAAEDRRYVESFRTHYAAMMYPELVKRAALAEERHPHHRAMRMNPFRRRRPRAAPSAPGANPGRIAALERDLFNVPPRPGIETFADALRRAGTCITHQPVADPDTPDTAKCAGCGRTMLLDDTGEWRPARP